MSDILQIPIVIKPFVRMNRAGDPEYGAPLNGSCYAEESVKVVVDNTGKEVVSNITFYIVPEVTIGDNDVLVYFGKEYPVKLVAAIRELDGTIVLWTVNA